MSRNREAGPAVRGGGKALFLPRGAHLTLRGVSTVPTFVTLETIRAARERIRDVIYHSPCPYSLSLSRVCGCEVYCKLDHLQITGSFKERGARNKLIQLAA